MFIHDWKKDAFTIPNLLSLFRLVLIPVYVTIYVNANERQEYYLAGLILAISCLTDLLDGKIARHFNMISIVGKILDPVADKMTQFSLMVCLSIKYPVLRSVLILFITKEVFQCVAGLINLRNRKILPGALFAGKICTAVLFLSLIILVMMPGLKQELIHIIAIVDSVFLCIAFVCYIFAYFGKNAIIQNLED